MAATATIVRETTRELRQNRNRDDLDGASDPGPAVFDAAYLQRLRNGDDETAKHFDHYFRRLVRAKVWGKFTCQREEDLVDDVMAAAIENIMRGQPRDASRLAAYVCGIFSNSMKRAVRPGRRDAAFVPVDLERVSDGAKTAERRMEEKEKAEAVRKTLSALSRRDREVLIDLFYHELSREEVCQKHAVTNAQLRLILFYAVRRFQKKWGSVHNTNTKP
jgi:RNA polymerase sigma factor (sigma-70 family)